MKDEKIIHELRLLKQIKLPAKDVREIQRDLDRRLFSHNEKRVLSWETVSSFAIAGALMAILLLFVFSPMATFFAMKTNIALAPNQYKKAQIAVAFTQHASFSILSPSLALANEQMVGLRLKGEQGKYTMQQCLDLYKQYHADLESLKLVLQNTPVTPANKENLEQVRAQIFLYDHQAENKLNIYKTSL